jgi:hypothetical protein
MRDITADLRISGSGFMQFRVQGLDFKVLGLGSRVQSLGFRALFRV